MAREGWIGSGRVDWISQQIAHGLTSEKEEFITAQRAYNLRTHCTEEGQLSHLNRVVNNQRSLPAALMSMRTNGSKAGWPANPLMECGDGLTD